MGDMDMFNRIYEMILTYPKSDKEAKPVSEALGLTNNVQKQQMPLQRIIDVTGLHPLQGHSVQTTSTVAKPTDNTGVAHDFPYPLDAIDEPMRRAAKAIQDMIDMFKECREGLITPAQRDICDEYVEFFSSLLREVFKKRMCLDMEEIGGK